MDYASLNRERIDRREIMDHLGGIEVPWSNVGGIRWDDISPDCLPVFLYKSKTPKAIIAANRFQMETIIKTDHEYVREVFIVEITRLMKHSNLMYCEDNIEKDRKFRHKKKRILSNEKKMMMKDIVQQLNRTRTAEDIAAAYKVTKSTVVQMAIKLRKSPYNFNIPTLRGYDEFNLFADEIAKENPGLVKKPMAQKSLKIVGGGG